MSNGRDRPGSRRRAAKVGRRLTDTGAVGERQGRSDSRVANPDREQRPGSGDRPATRVRASVLVASLRGFTNLVSTTEPRSIVRLLDDFFVSMADVGVGHRALLDRSMSEELMLVYGVPRPHKDDPARAVRSALDMQSTFLALRNRWLAAGRSGTQQLGLSIGVATGLVVFASFEMPSGRNPTPVGEAVSRAARLCRAASPAESLIDESTYAAAAPSLDEEARFTSREVVFRARDSVCGYRVQRQRAGLSLVPRRLLTDPVCRTVVDAGTALRRRIAGQTLYFCSEGCAERFAAHPEAFAS